MKVSLHVITDVIAARVKRSSEHDDIYDDDDDELQFDDDEDLDDEIDEANNIDDANEMVNEHLFLSKHCNGCINQYPTLFCTIINHE